MIEQVSYQAYVEARDKWYVNTLAEYGVPPEDILQSNWEGHGISIRVDMSTETEQICIKGEPVGEPYKLHPQIITKILYDHNKSKLILPNSTNN